MDDNSDSGSGGEAQSVAEGLRGPDAAAAFAEWRGHFPLAVTTIVPDAKHTPTRHLKSPDEVAAIVQETSGKANIYYTHGTLLELVNKKPKKEHFAGTDFVHADLDPPKKSPDGILLSPEQIDQWVSDTLDGLGEACRKNHIPLPSAVIRSGNGLNLLWRLDEFFAFGNPGDPEQRKQKIREIESRTRGICRALGADANTWNIDRVLRLPGGDNLPTKEKRGIGRVRRESSIVYLSDASYPVEAFPQVWDGEKPNPDVGSDAPGRIAIERGDAIRLTNLEELDQWNVPDRVKAIIVNGRNPHEPPKKGDDSRSAWMFDATCEMVRRDVPPGVIVGILTDKDYRVSDHIYDQSGDKVDYAWVQVENATAKVALDDADFARDKSKQPYANHQGNIRLALRKLGVRVRYEEFGASCLIEGLDGFGPHLGDAAMTRLWLTIEERFGVKAGKDFFWSVVEDAARRDGFHSVVEYLSGLRWDGVPRIDNWMATYLGAANDEYTQHVGALLLIAAVRRVQQPGCKFDEMVILESEQGKDKSTALAILAVREEWFSDDLPLGVDAKVIIERTQGRWIVEAAELDGMGKKDVEGLKAMLSRRRDRSRMAFGRMTHDAPRQFVVIGTTNGQQYLRDSTGNRRFWPVRLGNVDVEALRRDRDQLWAEAAKREAEGASIRLNKDLWKVAAAEQGKRRLLDPYFVALDEALGDETGKIRARDVWLIVGVPVDRRTPQHEQRVGEAMRELGFERKQGRFGGGPEYAYLRGTKAERLRQIEVMGDERTGWTVLKERPAKPERLPLEEQQGDGEPF